MYCMYVLVHEFDKSKRDPPGYLLIQYTKLAGPDPTLQNNLITIDAVKQIDNWGRVESGFRGIILHSRRCLLHIDKHCLSPTRTY